MKKFFINSVKSNEDLNVSQTKIQEIQNQIESLKKDYISTIDALITKTVNGSLYIYKIYFN
jgi:hypothetical protein